MLLIRTIGEPLFDHGALLLSFVFLKHDHVGPQLVAAVAVVVGGVVLLIIA